MAKPSSPLRRCAVYTRKSSEDGLEQTFNSLHAQREACEAFIRSQQGEGWRLVESAYDDGGLSGGTLDRPALQRLLADVGHGQVDIIVVYKVDRLTRSLMDFAKIVEQFDRNGVSFVAVTQQFNTTTSMGRLTLNILLSFAQFEREVTGERIRDKIAASKRKGMWMGGVTPLGYEVQSRKLIVVPAEAKTVRLIYQRYLELGSVRLLKHDLDQRSIRSKVRTHQDGTRTGGRPFSRGALYALLANPIYIGEISHKGARYAGQHDPILDRALWDTVQHRLREQGPKRREHTGKVTSSPLMGKLFDEEGGRLSPSHAIKNGRRYRYYVSRGLVTGTSQEVPRGWRLPALQIEKLVASEVANILGDRSGIAAALEKNGIPADQSPSALAAAERLRACLLSEVERAAALLSLVDRVELGRGSFRVTISLGALFGDGHAEITLAHELPLAIKRRGVEMRLVSDSHNAAPAKADPILLKEVARAHRCFDALLTGRASSIAALAMREGIHDRYVSSLLPLAFLAPEIIEAIVRGAQPKDLTAKKLIRRIHLPLEWQAQKQALGFT
jgi:DNA invertase Pin-like site-specific DNA recombinase